MNDDPVIPLPPGRAVDIPARFIRQAFEHLQHTGDRYVTFIFAGEMVADAVCYGISTQRPAPVKLITDQRPATEDAPTWTIKSLTNNVIIDVIRAKGPINTKLLADELGIERGDIPLRQRVRRVLEALVQARLIRKTGDKRYPDFMIGQRIGRPPGPASAHAGRKRSDITEAMVIEQLQHGPISSRDIGDNLNMDRKDNYLRGRITEIVGRMFREGRIRHVAGNLGTGRLYELIEQDQVPV